MCSRYPPRTKDALSALKEMMEKLETIGNEIEEDIEGRDGKLDPFEEEQNLVEVLRNGIDEVGSIGIGLLLIVSKKASEIGVRISQKGVARGFEALAADN